jgi:hypothetical protein
VKCSLSYFSDPRSSLSISAEMPPSTITPIAMASISSWLSDISRRNMRTAGSGRGGLRDSNNLCRFVLLKNSITHAESPSPSLFSQSALLVPDDDHSEVIVLSDTRPVTMSLGRCPDTTPTLDSEEKWLESVLETLDDDFDRDVEVEVHQGDDNDVDFLDPASQDSFESWVPPYDALPIPSDNFLSAATPVLSPQFQPLPSLEFLLNSPDSHFNQQYVEPRYPVVIERMVKPEEVCLIQVPRTYGYLIPCNTGALG